MRRRYFNSKLINNKIIIYTSADNLIVVPYRYNFGANAITNIINNNIGKITFDGDVTTIGELAFSECKSLTSVTIPNSVTTIGGYAFDYCTSLKSIIIGNGVESIGTFAFSSCSSLKNVYCKATTPPVAEREYNYWKAFDHNASDRKIYVPIESVEAYKCADGWKDYANSIVGYDF